MLLQLVILTLTLMSSPSYKHLFLERLTLKYQLKYQLNSFRFFLKLKLVQLYCNMEILKNELKMLNQFICKIKVIKIFKSKLNLVIILKLKVPPSSRLIIDKPFKLNLELSNQEKLVT